MAENLSTLKRKCATLRSKATRFATAINNSTEDITLDDLEHYRGRLQETLERLVTLYDSIPDPLDKEYATDVQ